MALVSAVGLGWVLHRSDDTILLDIDPGKLPNLREQLID